MQTLKDACRYNDFFTASCDNWTIILLSKSNQMKRHASQHLLNYLPVTQIKTTVYFAQTEQLKTSEIPS